MAVHRIRLYQPSNGTEGEYFFAQWCERCDRDDTMNGRADWEHAEKVCQIIGDTMAYNITDPEYPKEWRYGRHGPECTAFRPMREPGPSIAFRDERTIDMFTDPPTSLAGTP